jgi:acylphosphatase
MGSLRLARMARVRRRVVVSGRVQGVFFRDTCEREARAAGVGGWVRNSWDGAVEAVFEGEPDAVDRMVAWCRDGPPRATVTSVEVHDEPPVGDDQFRVRGYD